MAGYSVHNYWKTKNLDPLAKDPPVGLYLYPPRSPAPLTHSSQPSR